MIDPRDLALQGTCPTLAAPRFGALPEMKNGQRVVVAANGVFVQMKLDWLGCILRPCGCRSGPAAALWDGSGAHCIRVRRDPGTPVGSIYRGRTSAAAERGRRRSYLFAPHRRAALADV